MKMRVTTETGSYYDIDTDSGHWVKNGIDEHYTLSQLKSGPVGTFPWDKDHNPTPGWKDVLIPEVGKYMYIHGRGISDWWRSTEVVSVEEIKDEI